MSWITHLAAHAPFLLTVTPLFGAALVWISSRHGIAAARQTAVINASLTVFVAGLMVWNFSADAASAAQMTSAVPWFQWPLRMALPSSSLQVVLAFGVDGVSVGPLAILALVGWVCVATADRTGPPEKEPPYAGLLLGQSLSMSLFAAQDFALWILCCQLWTWWAFILVGRHGDSDRRAAARTLLLTSSLAHACWMLAGIGMAVGHGWIQTEVRHRSAGVSFLYSDLVGSLSRWISGNETALRLWTAFGPWVLLLWLVGLWLRWPLFPAHFGLTGLLTQARAPIAAFCGATMILQGGFVLFRFVVPLLPAAGTGAMTLLSACAGFGVLYFGLAATAQRHWRALGGCLSLSALHGAWLCGTSGSVSASLAGWQMACVASLLIAAMWMLIGWWERQGSTVDFDRLTNQAQAAPRWFGLMAVCGGLWGALPCFSVISGHAVVNWLELRRRGVPNLTLLIGSLLTAWSVIRVILQTGYGAAANDRPGTGKRPDVRGRDWLVAAPIVAALAILLAPGVWEWQLGSTWKALHDPFAAAVAPTSSIDSAESGELITANKPAETVMETTPDAPWPGAPLVWAVCGVSLLLLPRGLLSTRWSSVIALLGWGGGWLAEWAVPTRVESPGSAWVGACLSSLTLIGLLKLTRAPGPSGPVTAAFGGTLLRLGAIGWSAGTNDLLFAGLAWELAEVGRWFSPPGGTASAARGSREQLRLLISSCCFWIGIAVLAISTQTTRIAGLALQLAAVVPRNDEGVIIGIASKPGLAAVILLCTAVGMRCGLLPWSFGRDDRRSRLGCGVGLLNQWLDQLLGLTMLVQFALALGEGFGGPLTILLAMSAAATALWNGLRVAGEGKVVPILRAITVVPFASLVLLAAGLAAKPIALSTGFREQFDQASFASILAQGLITASLAWCALVALIERWDMPQDNELFLEHYRGLFVRRPREATLLTGLLLCLSGQWQFAAFVPGWIGLTSLIMTPLSPAHDLLRPHPVLLAASIICFVANLPLLSRIADWIRLLAFDPPVSLPNGSARPWSLVMAGGLAVVLAAWTVFPRLLMSIFAQLR